MWWVNKSKLGIPNENYEEVLIAVMEGGSEDSQTPRQDAQITPPRRTPQFDILQSSAKRVRQLSEDFSADKRKRISHMHSPPEFHSPHIPRGLPTMAPASSFRAPHKAPESRFENGSTSTANILQRMRDYLSSVRDTEPQRPNSTHRSHLQGPPTISPPVLQPSPHLDESKSNEFSIQMAPEVAKSVISGTNYRSTHPLSREFRRKERTSDENPSSHLKVPAKRPVSHTSSYDSVTPPRHLRNIPLSQGSSSSMSSTRMNVHHEENQPHMDKSGFPLGSSTPRAPETQSIPSSAQTSSRVTKNNRSSSGRVPLTFTTKHTRPNAEDWSIEEWTALETAMADVVTFDVDPTRAVDHVKAQLPYKLQKTPRRQIVNRMRALLIWNQRKSLSKQYPTGDSNAGADVSS